MPQSEVLGKIKKTVKKSLALSLSLSLTLSRNSGLNFFSFHSHLLDGCIKC